jgi:outer membrane protein TolC
VHTVADQMNAFLARAVEWVDVAAARVSVVVIRPRIQAAVLSHPEVRLALEQQQTAAQVRREALAGMLPQIAANADSGRRHFDQVSTPYASVPDHTQRASSFGVSASQLLYDFGAVGGRLKAQDAREIAAQANALSRSSQLALRAVSAWYELFRARELVNLAETNRQSRRQILNFIEEREQLGGSSRSDVLRVRARLSDAQAALVFAESRRNAADSVYREVFNTARLWSAWLKIGEIGDRNAVMLVVIGNECDEIVFVSGFALQKVLPPGDHFFVLRGLQNNMSEFDG